MMRHTECRCVVPHTGQLAHAPWDCKAGKHSQFLVPSIQGNSIIHWSRNAMIAKAMLGPQPASRPKAEYYLLMDDDMVVEPHWLKRMLSYKEDIVTGISTTKRDPPRPNIFNWIPERRKYEAPFSWDWKSEKLFEVDAVGTAFMLVKAVVLERMGQAYLDCTFERQEDARKYPGNEESITAYWDKKSALRTDKFNKAMDEGRDQDANCWWFQFFDNTFDEQLGEFGEDVGFCWKAQQLGFKILADPQINPGHLGPYAYSIKDYSEWAEMMKDTEQVKQLNQEQLPSE